MDLFSKNLQAIKHKDRDLFNRLKKVTKAPYVSFIPSRSGKIVAEVLGKDGKRYLLHSAYDPCLEAEEVAARVKWIGVSHVLVLGVGCGYQLPAILARVSPKVKVYAVEPDISLFRSVLEVFDWSDLIRRQNLYFIVGLSPSLAVETIMGTLNPVEVKALEIFKHPVYYRLLQGYFSELEKELSESIRISLVNLVTALQFSFRDHKNTLLNLKYLEVSSPVRNLFGAFSGKPAVVVCAGPSLDKNIHYLYEVKDRVLVIAVDTALRPLIERKIYPHIVVAGDPQDANFDHFRIVPPWELKDIFLVAELRVSPLIFKYWSGKIFLCDFGSQIMRWITSSYGDIGRLMVWGSVSTVAISLAVELGCDPVILMGQDLSFTGLRRYASYTWVDETSSNQVDPAMETLLREKDLWGKDAWTAKNMLAYRDWLEQFFKRVKRRFVNSTEGGILVAGVKTINFLEAIARFLSQPFDALGVLRRLWSPLKKGDRFKKEIIEKLLSLKKVLEDIKSICEGNLALLERLCGKINEEIKDGEERIRSLMRGYSFLEEGFLPYFISFNREIEKLRELPEENALMKECEAYAFLFAGVKETALSYINVVESSVEMMRGE